MPNDGLRIIFLDVDGVLNTNNASTLGSLSKSKLRLLSLLIENTGAKIVLSSTWRLYPEYYAKLRRALLYRGLLIYSKTPWYTGADQDHSRGIEISTWMQRNKVYMKEFVILDDTDTFLDHQKQNLFLCNPDEGLTLQTVLDCTDFLTKGGSPP